VENRLHEKDQDEADSVGRRARQINDFKAKQTEQEKQVREEELKVLRAKNKDDKVEYMAELIKDLKEELIFKDSIILQTCEQMRTKELQFLEEKMHLREIMARYQVIAEQEEKLSTLCDILKIFVVCEQHFLLK